MVTHRTDAVDAIVEQWHAERPDLDASAKEVTGRIVRLGSLLVDAYRRAFRELGLSEGTYGVLVALRRAGAPFELTPTEIARTRMMTSGGLTPVLDRLERDGLLERRPNPDDRRGNLVRLSGKGRRLVDRAMALHVEVEHALLAGLSNGERERLVRLLRKLLVSLEEPGALPSEG